MSEERVDIVVTDNISDKTATKLTAIATSAREAHAQLQLMQKSINAIKDSSVKQLAKEHTTLTKETNRAAVSNNMLAASQLRVEAQGNRTQRTLAQLNTEQQRGELIAARVTTEGLRGLAVVDRTALAVSRAAEASALRASRMEREGDAAVKLYAKNEQLRAQQQASNAQGSFNSLLGVGVSSGGSARASASVFVQDAHDKALAAKATEDLASRAERLRIAIDPLYAAQNRYDRELLEANTLLRAGSISQATHAQAVAMSTAVMNNATGASKRFTDQTKLNRFQVLTLQYTINDIAASLASGASPFTILMQQGGQVTQAWGGLVPTLRAAGSALFSIYGLAALGAGSVAALAVAYTQGAAEGEAFTRALIMTGNAAGTTTLKLTAQAKAVAEATGSTVGNSSAALASLAGSSNILAAQFEKIATVSVRMQKATGTAVADTVKQFAELGKDPLTASLKLNESTHFLTLSVYEQIKSLTEQGNLLAAGVVAQNAWFDVANERTPKLLENLGYAERAWREIGNTAAKAWDQFKGVGRGTDPATELAANLKDAQNRLLMLQGDAKGTGGAELRGRTADVVAQEKIVAALQQRIVLTQRGSQSENRISAEKAAQARLMEAQVAADKEHDKYLSKAERMERARAVVNTVYDAAPKTAANEANRKAALAEIADRFKDKDAAKAIKEEESRAKAMVRVNDELNKELNSLGLLGPEREKQQKLAEIEIQLRRKDKELSAEERAGFAKKISDIADARLGQAALTSAYEAAIGPRRTLLLVEEATEKLVANGKISSAEAARQVQLATQAYKDQIDPLQAINRGLDEQARLRGFVGRAREVEAQIIAAEAAQRGKGVDGSAASKEANDALRKRLEVSVQQAAIDTELQNIRASTVGTIETLGAKQTALTQAYERGYIGLAKYGEGLVGIQAQMFEMSVALGNDTFSDRMAESFNRNVKSMDETFVTFLKTGKLEIEDFVKTWLYEMAKIEFNRTITSPFQAAGGIGKLLGLFGGSPTGNIAAGAQASGAYTSPVLGGGSGAAIGVPLPALAAQASYAVGTPYVPRDMVAQIHQGERIVTAAENRNYGKGGSTIMLTSSPTITIDARSDQAQIQQLVERGIRNGNAQLVNDLQIAGKL